MHAADQSVVLPKTQQAKASDTAPLRLLVVSVSVPPAPTAVAFVSDNLSRQFARDEMVIAGERSPGSEGYRRAGDLPPICLVAREWTWPKRGRRYFRWLRWFAVPMIVHRMRRLARRHNCNAVLAIFPDERMLLAAYLTARREKLAFFPWFHNTYLDNRRGLSLRLARWLQPRTFAAARVVFVMSEGMQAAWRRQFPGVRFEPLVHTFSDEIPDFDCVPNCRLPVRLVFLGNLNESNLDAMRRIYRLINESDDAALTIYSGSPSWFFAKVGIAGPRVRYEQISDEELQSGLASHDILLLPHGFTGGLRAIEYETIFPTRTIPYLLSGRPILAHCPRDCFLTRWLRKHDCAEIVDQPDVGALKVALNRLRNDATRREELVRNGLLAVREFHGPRVIRKFRDVVRESMCEPEASKSTSS
jgi:hypothetical protein